MLESRRIRGRLTYIKGINFLSKKFRFSVLDRMWPDGNWHFLVAERIGRFQSETVTNLVSKAKKSNKFVFAEN